MLSAQEIIKTLGMIKKENLDVRTITLGISLRDCVSDSLARLQRNIKSKISRIAENLVPACNKMEARYSVPIINKRIAVTPLASICEGLPGSGYIKIAKHLDTIAQECSIDLLGGYSAYCEKGITTGDSKLIDTIPEVLSTTKRICSSVNVASTKAGINMEAIRLMGKVVKDTAYATRRKNSFGCAKLVVFSNIPQDNPFMAGALFGYGEGECAINVGVSGPGVIKHAVEEFIHQADKVTLTDLAQIIKKTSFQVTRAGEFIGRQIAEELGIPFGIVDLSLAPTPSRNDSVGEIIELLGIDQCGAPGSTAALALLTDAVKKGGLFASSSVGGLSGAFIPIAEDATLARAAAAGTLTLEKCEAMTSICSVGLDMIALPGDTTAETLAAIIADEMAIGVVNNKTTATRLIPVHGKKAGQIVSFGGLFGQMKIMRVRANNASKRFVDFAGHIPAPLRSLTN